MTPEEKDLVQSAGIALEVGHSLKMATQAPIHRLQGWDPHHGLATHLPGVGSVIEEENALPALGHLRGGLPEGYQAFWGERDILAKETELGVIKSGDPYDVVRAKGTNALSHEITTEAVIDRLKSWARRCVFTISGAALDWVALSFSTLPADLDAFAREIYEFCPDTIDQHFGCFFMEAEMMREMNLEVPSGMLDLMHGLNWANPHEAGLQVLCRSLQRDKYLMLWWDTDNSDAS